MDKPIDVINGHVSSNDPFNLEIEKILLNDYVNEHKEKAKILYSKLNSDIIQNKEHIIEKRNQNRDDPDIFQPQNQVFIKKHTRQKNANKFKKPTKIKTTNPERKTVSTENQAKIHMDNLKRPLRNT